MGKQAKKSPHGSLVNRLQGNKFPSFPPLPAAWLIIMTMGTSSQHEEYAFLSVLEWADKYVNIICPTLIAELYSFSAMRLGRGALSQDLIFKQSGSTQSHLPAEKATTNQAASLGVSLLDLVNNDTVQ